MRYITSPKGGVATCRDDIKKKEKKKKDLTSDTIPAKSSHLSDEANCEAAFVKGVKTGVAKQAGVQVVTMLGQFL